MALRDIPLRQEYRFDRNDIVSELIVPCLNNCAEYDRCAEYVSLRGLAPLVAGAGAGFARGGARLRAVCGHRFFASDLDYTSRLLAGKRRGRRGAPRGGAPTPEDVMRGMADAGRIMVRVAVPDGEPARGGFAERVGIFRDAAGDAVAFNGTSNQTFGEASANFESVDVFTSWEDAGRVETKIRDFENLWSDRTEHVSVHDFSRAERDNLLSYAFAWAEH